MAVAPNADVYASTRLGIYFPGVVPSLDGQCVSLVKWFMAEMSDVPNPQAPRGDARYVGHTLVDQGHAVEVPYDQRRRGDIITYEYGQYGHIGVVLSGDRTFEENVNWPGVASKVVDGARVYASRIGSLGEAWRHDMHIYRLKSYNEEGEHMSAQDVIVDHELAIKLCNALLHRNPDPAFYPTVEGKPLWNAIDIVVGGEEYRAEDAKIKAPSKFVPVTDQLYKEG